MRTANGPSRARGSRDAMPIIYLLSREHLELARTPAQITAVLFTAIFKISRRSVRRTIGDMPDAAPRKNLAAADRSGAYHRTAGDGRGHGYGDRSPGGYDVRSAFVVEVVLTAFLVLTVLGTTEARAPAGFAGLAIGLVLTVIHLVGIPVTNTSVNPARSIGPALFAGAAAQSQLWLFIVAPLIGAGVAAGLFAVIRPPASRLSAQVTETGAPLEPLERLAR